MKFKAELFLAGKTATGIRVPDKVVEGLGASKRPAVKVTFNGYTYRTTVAPMSGEYFIPVAAAIREASGASAGDMLSVTIELDTEPRIVEVPDVLARELKKDKHAAEVYRKTFLFQQEGNGEEHRRGEGRGYACAAIGEGA